MVARLIPVVRSDGTVAPAKPGTVGNPSQPPASDLSLQTTGSDAGVELRGQELHIGEDPRGKIVVGDASHVANPRAVLRQEEYRWVVRSAGSHELRVNGKATAEASLRKDDVLELGDGSARFTFRDEEDDSHSYDPVDRWVRFVEQAYQLPHEEHLCRHLQRFLLLATHADEVHILNSDAVSLLGEGAPSSARDVVKQVRSEKQLVFATDPGGSSMLCVPNFSSSPALFVYLARHQLPHLTDEDRQVAAACVRLAPTLQHSLRIQSSLTEEIEALRQHSTQSLEVHSGGAAFQKVLQDASHCAQQGDATLLIGEPGTGKGAVGRFMHASTERAGGRFVAVHCNDQLTEAELFGCARQDVTLGKLQRAHRGTLFLDEIDTLPLALQSKLLKVLRDRLVTPEGSDQPSAIDVLVIGSTDADLEALVEAGRFDRNLYHHLQKQLVWIPPLRERSDEVLSLAHYFLEKMLRPRERQAQPPIATDAAQFLAGHHWPGNVRELRQRIESAFLRAGRDTIRAEHLQVSGDSPRTSREKNTASVPTLADLEHAHILRVLQITQGNKKEAARLLGIHRNTLTLKLQRAEATEE